MKDFSYENAFTRNIGWVTQQEQQVLRGKRVAIAGLGGVGGSHLLTLVRLGIGRFHIADFDRFGLNNFNRQAGAFVSSLDHPKTQVLSKLARDINPDLSLVDFPEGVHADKIDEFLRGVDLFVDGLDYFALDIRRQVFKRCSELGIPAITAAPLGMGVALVNFLPAGMKFDSYFMLEGKAPDDQAIHFLMGLAPRLLQLRYLTDRARVDFDSQSGPSTVMACQLCAGVAATEALKILLRRGRVLSAPWSLQFDAYRYRLVRNWRPGGNRNPLQRVAIAIVRHMVRRERRKRAAERVPVR